MGGHGLRHGNVRGACCRAFPLLPWGMLEFYPDLSHVRIGRPLVGNVLFWWRTELRTLRSFGDRGRGGRYRTPGAGTGIIVQLARRAHLLANKLSSPNNPTIRFLVDRTALAPEAPGIAGSAKARPEHSQLAQPGH